MQQLLSINQPRPPVQSVRGFTLIELLFTLLISGIVLSTMMVVALPFFEYPRAISAGATLSHVRKEAERIIEDHYALTYSVAESGPIAITMATMANYGYLNPARIEGTGPNRQIRNSFNQTHVVLFRQDGNNGVAMTVTNGAPADPSLVLDASTMDPNGGRVVNDPVYCAGISNPCIRGNYDSYRIDLDDWDTAATNSYIPVVGNFVAVSYFGSNGEVLKPYLYRQDIGNPSANTMSTNIDMGGNSILNVEDICLTSTGECLAGAVGLRGTVPHNSLVAMPTCPANNPVPKIIASLQVFADDGDNLPVAAAGVITQPEGSNWRILLPVLTQDGTEYPPSAVGRATVNTFCAPS